MAGDPEEPDQAPYPAWWDLRYLPIRTAFVLLRLTVLLPLPLIYLLGDLAGCVMHLVMRRRRAVARRNLELCYPGMTGEEIRHLVRQNFRSMGRAVFETGMAWYWSDARLRRHMEVSEESIRNIMDNAASGQLVLTCHFLDLELHARMYGLYHPGVGLYKPNRNPVIEREQTRGRTRTNIAMVSHRNIRGIIKALKDGYPIWYAADQDYHTYSRVFVPFMAVPDCPTVTAPSTLARIKNVVSIPSYAVRIPGGKYRLVVEPKLENYPTGDLAADAEIYNRFVARAVNEAPDQYMWVHRRFKNRPNSTDPSYYDDSAVHVHRNS